MDDRIRELDDQIKVASKEVDSLSAIRKLNQASFDSNALNVKQLEYYMSMVVSLRKEKLLLMAKDESTTVSAPAPPGNSITLPQVLPPFFHRLFPLLPLFLQNSLRQPLQLNYKICGWVDEEGGGRLCGRVCCCVG